MSAPARYWMDVRRWRTALRDAVDLPIATRGVLSVLAQWMNADGSNAWPSRKRLAACCGISESAIDRHLAIAIRAGYLQRTGGGRRGHVAVHAATIPADRWDSDAEKIRTLDSASVMTRYAELARHSQRVSASLVQRKRVTGDAPTSSTTSDKHLAASKEAGSSLRDERDEDELEDEEQERANDEERERDEQEREDAYERIEAELGGLDAVEASTVDGMLWAGVHAKAIVNKVNKCRRSPVA